MAVRWDGFSEEDISKMKSHSDVNKSMNNNQKSKGEFSSGVIFFIFSLICVVLLITMYNGCRLFTVQCHSPWFSPQFQQLLIFHIMARER